MDNEQEERAQIIIDKFRTRTIMIQEELLAEQVAHEITKRQLAKLLAEGLNGNSQLS